MFCTADVYPLLPEVVTAILCSRWRVDTVGSAVLHWIVRFCRQCTVSSTGEVANRSSMRADNIHGTWIFSQNADNIHGTWIFPRNADTFTIIFTTRMK